MTETTLTTRTIHKHSKYSISELKNDLLLFALQLSSTSSHIWIYSKQCRSLFLVFTSVILVPCSVRCITLEEISVRPTQDCKTGIQSSNRQFSDCDRPFRHRSWWRTLNTRQTNARDTDYVNLLRAVSMFPPTTSWSIQFLHLPARTLQGPFSFTTFITLVPFIYLLPFITLISPKQTALYRLALFITVTTVTLVHQGVMWGPFEGMIGTCRMCAWFFSLNF